MLTHRLSRFVVLLTALATVPAAVLWSQVPASSQSDEVVRAIGLPLQPLPAESASAGVTKFTFLAYGDTRGRRDGVELQYEHSLIVNSMLVTIQRLENTDYPVRFVVQSGDAVVNGRSATQWNRSFIGLIDRLTMEAGVPYFLAPGNHDLTASTDLANPGRLTGLRNFLDATANLIPPDGNLRRLDGYPTYAFGYGNTFLLAIDSNIADDETQFAWVKWQLEDLDRTRYRNIIAFFHHPPFSSGPHGGATLEPTAEAMRTRYQPLFRRHQVRMTIGGHEHLYEHWVERYTDASGERRRMDHLVTGGGGAPLYTYRGEPDLRDYRTAGAGERIAVEHLVKPGPEPGDNPYHYVVLQVDGEDIQLDVVGVDWGAGFAPYRTAHQVLKDGGGQ